MTINIDQELPALQLQINAAQSKKARAEVEKENALAALLSARTSLKEEFGVNTNEEAKALLETLATELETSVTAVRQALALSGAV